jgi:SAM-dependent methyltransferase
MGASYTIDGGRQGKQRLDVLADVMHATTTTLLQRAGVRSGARCVDIGCGGGHVSRELAGLVGEGGSVLALDIDPSVLELASADADEAGIGNIEFRVGSAEQMDDAPYDLAYARFLLSHVEDPLEVVRQMAGALAPGGTAIVEDIDFSGSFCHPPSDAYERYVGLYRETVRRRGGNADIGPLLPSLLRTAGLSDVHVAVVQPCGLDGDAKLISPLTLERIAESALAESVVGRDELAQTLGELYRYHEDPTTIMSLPRVVQAWARR